MRLQYSKLSRIVILAVALLTPPACNDALSPSPDEGNPSAAIASPLDRSILELSPAGPIDLHVGDTVSIKVTGRAALDEVLFLASDSGVASVTTGGLVAALAPGEIRVGV